jgi:hypothetical protein
MGDAITFSDVWNATKDVASLMVNSESVHMPNAAFAVPGGHQPADLDWADEFEQTMHVGLTWTNLAESIGLSSGVLLRIGATWKAGGKLNGAGRFLHEARLWAVLDYSSLGSGFEVTGSFGDPYLRGQTGVLGGVIEVHASYIHLHWETIRYQVEITGTGAGQMTLV